MARGRGGLREVLTDFAKRAVSSFVTHVAVGNVGGGEDDLHSVTLPKYSLKNPGDYFTVKAWGTTANNANAKTLTIYWGGVAIATIALAANIAGRWVANITVVRTGKSTQDIIVEINEGTAAIGSASQRNAIIVATGAVAEDAAAIFKCTATGVADNDLVQEGMLVESTTIPT